MVQLVNKYAIELKNVCKKYELFDSKKDRILEAINPFGKIYHRDFWALKDITLNIPGGQTVGILGVNGSGKSTLLQIISSVLQPTKGEVNINGKVAALLELGAGFNSELTARENVIMNSTIMGLSSKEIQERIGDIQTFADVGDFFDQPMKIFSSGMFARVAFATAIHVEPDILIIDEALSVGDARFVEKCYRKIDEFRNNKKTIIYVTHDRTSISRLCDHAILLDKGKVVSYGNPKNIVERYSEILAMTNSNIRYADVTDNFKLDEKKAGKKDSMLFQHVADLACENPTYNKNEYRFGNDRASILNYKIKNESKINKEAVKGKTMVDIYMQVLFRDSLIPLPGFAIRNSNGEVIYGVNSELLEIIPRKVYPGEVKIYMFSFTCNLSDGDWFIDLAIKEKEASLCDVRRSIAVIHVHNANNYIGITDLNANIKEIENE